MYFSMVHFMIPLMEVFVLFLQLVALILCCLVNNGDISGIALASNFLIGNLKETLSRKNL